MTNAALVDALHRAIRELENPTYRLATVGEYSSVVKGVIANLQEVIDRTLEDEKEGAL